MFCKGYQIEATSHADLSLSIHDRINELHRRAERLAPAIERSALDSGCTDQTKASHANLGPRQRTAWNMVAEAHAWNAISDSPDELAKAEAAERAGHAYEVVGIWGDEGHDYEVRVYGEGDEPEVSPFVADPLNPTDDELAAAIERGLADGSIIDSAEFLAQAAQDDPEPQAETVLRFPGFPPVRGVGPVITEVPAAEPYDVTIPRDGGDDASYQSWRAAREHPSPRCATCHRDAHRPGTGWQGHFYEDPRKGTAQPQPGKVIYDARTTGEATTAAGLFSITVRRVGYDEHVGTTYKVERNARTH